MHISGRGAVLFYPVFLSAYSFRNSGWYEIKGLLI